jgi:alkanesulfonate monooxygenase SsuD/methylene tetrahydromethanopterin reductase-like flavin-dependent oxidoreductase (luciferase family)
MILGVGVGGEFTEEFEACGVPLSERGARTNEGLDVIRRLWTEDSVTHEGRFYSFHDATMLPRPVQSGGPTIWIGGRSDAALRRTARYGGGWVRYLMTPERVAAGMEKIRGLAKKMGRESEEFFCSIVQFCCLDDSRETARLTALNEINWGYRTNFEKVFDRYVPHGPPDAIVENVKQFVEAGV